VIFFICSILCCLSNVSADAFGVQTEFVAVDFNDGAAAYDKIRPRLEHKDIGILGQSQLLLQGVHNSS